jgi:hypothetical protein
LSSAGTEPLSFGGGTTRRTAMPQRARRIRQAPILTLIEMCQMWEDVLRPLTWADLNLDPATFPWSEHREWEQRTGLDSSWWRNGQWSRADAKGAPHSPCSMHFPADSLHRAAAEAVQLGGL